MSANIRPSGVFDTTYGQNISLNRTIFDKVLSNGLFIVLLIIPLLSIEGPLGLRIIPQSWIGIIVRIAIAAIAVQGLNILTGYTGQISLGHAAFMAVGAYSSAIFVRELGFTFWTALPTAALFTGVIGLIFGLPSLRVKGFYLAMATLAAQFIIPWVIRNPLADITNGSGTLNTLPPTFFGISLGGESAFYYVVIPLATLLFLFARNITRTRVGRAFISVRDNDLAAELLGINVFNYKLQAFFLSSLYAGIAGALTAFETNSIAIDQFPLPLSITMLSMLVIGGAGFSLGPFFGATFVIVLTQQIVPELTDLLKDILPQLIPFFTEVNIAASLSPLLFGFALMVFLIAEPRGIAYRWEILKIGWKIRPYSY